MEKDFLYIKTSPALRLIRVAAVVFMVLSILCMYLSAEDFRGQKQKDKDISEALHSNMLCEDAFLLADAILANPDAVCRYSDVVEINMARSTKGRTVAEVRYVIAGVEGVACFGKNLQDEEFTLLSDNTEYDTFIHRASVTVKYSLYLTERGAEILFEEAMEK